MPDVVIVGGGIIGAASAYELARRGAGVTLIERDELAAGASGRNQGWFVLSSDPALGPMVVVAAGGVLVELMADRAVALPPVSHAGAVRMLDRLRLRPLLDGFRGAPPVDLDALADVVVAVSLLARDHGTRIDALDLNPVVATPEGAVAVDVLIIPSTDEETT